MCSVRFWPLRVRGNTGHYARLYLPLDYRATTAVRHFYSRSNEAAATANNLFNIVGQYERAAQRGEVTPPHTQHMH